MSNFKVGEKARFVLDTDAVTGENIYSNCEILDIGFSGNGKRYRIMIEKENKPRWTHESWVYPLEKPPSLKEVSWDE